MYTGKIYLTDFEGQPIGIGQPVSIHVNDSGYAAYLSTDDGNVRIGDYWGTEDQAATALKAGGGGTVIVIDDL